MAVDPTAPVSGPYQAAATQKATTKKANDLFSSEGFLKLLAKEMQSQNPLEPMKDSEYIAQMAQFSQLEQITSLNQSMQNFAMTSQLTQGSSLIGKQVSYLPKDATVPVTGTVDRLVLNNGQLSLMVGDVAVNPKQVTEVKAA